jgi:glycosyltransferase involved in cell wall biosynthesis
MNRSDVSVVIPAHNSSSTIVRALDSVTNQSRVPLEILVINDASQDNTRLVVEEYAKSSPIPIHIHSFETNHGPGVARNYGWDNAKGDYVAFLDADDVWHPRKVEIQSALMDSRSTLMMSCHEHHFGVDNPWQDLSQIPLIDTFNLSDFLWKNRCATPTVMFRRQVSQRFDPARVIIGVEDYLLWMRVVALHGPCVKILAPLANCANPAFGGTGLSGRLWAMERGELNVYQTLYSEGRIGFFRLVVADAWSFAKFIVRLIDRRVFPTRSRQR